MLHRRYRPLDIDVVMPEELADRGLLSRIIFNYQQAFAPPHGILLDASESRLQLARGGRFGYKCKGPVRKAMMTVLIEGEHLDRNMPRLRSCLRWLSTVQPSMSGKNTSSEMAAG